MTYIHVATTGDDTAEGHEDSPVRTINRAAYLAQPGDTVLVHPGTYREWVKPVRGGRSDRQRITFQPAQPGTVVIKGSERVDSWVRVSGSTWMAEIPNEVFGDFNPFARAVEGDWVVSPRKDEPQRHLGDVYLNGRSFFEADSKEQVFAPEVRDLVIDAWTGTEVEQHDPDSTKYVWFAQVTDDVTTIWANFHEADPNTELTEISVRRSVFWPTEHHLDYITVRGFELAQAATPWTPPTADQPGLIGPNWAKGWVIEDNHIHDAKCSAVSLGKEAGSGDNYSHYRMDKPGYQYQLESVFTARQFGWDKEHIGSHVVRGNRIHDCGQNAIVGHLGCVFSTIEGNHISHIATKREFFGHEIGAIKLHAAIDVQIRENRIHDSTLGLWLDWQTQGTRVSRNLMYNNNRDIFVEVSHGPYVIDNNIFASPASIENFSQGGAWLHNLVAGSNLLQPVVERPTPYHRPHSTQVAGYAAILGGDDRYIGNVFAPSVARTPYGEKQFPKSVHFFGTSGYDAHPGSMEEYLEHIKNSTLGDHDRYAGVPQPVYISRNVYGPGASAWQGEQGAHTVERSDVLIEEDGENVFLVIDLSPDFSDCVAPLPTEDDLPPVRFAAVGFEEPDGSTLDVRLGYDGVVRDSSVPVQAGPFAQLKAGSQRIKVW